MAKTTKAQGPSFSDDELSDPHPPVQVKRAILGQNPEELQRGELTESEGIERSDESSVGTVSSQPSSSGTRSSEQTKQTRQEHARTTESRSGPLETEDSTALLTGGHGQRTQQPQSDELENYEEWSKEELQEELRQRGLAVSGNKNELISRLRENDNSGNEFSDFE